MNFQTRACGGAVTLCLEDKNNTMGKYLNPTNRGFEIARNSQIYVDKTGLIKYTNRVMDTEQRFICVSRPRRFGKSMAAQMLLAYYCGAYDSYRLFQGLEIEKDDSFSRHLNQYDVVFLDMQKFLNRAGTPMELTAYLQKNVLAELKETYGEYISSEETGLAAGLEKIEEKAGKEFIFIIDEWDCVFRETREDSAAQKKYLDFLRDLFKGQTYVKLVYMTGILPIKKYGTHSALNIFNEYSMTDPKEMAEYTGFTEEEVQELCRQYGMDFFQMQKWYDGYRLKNVAHTYNPKSVVDALLNAEFHSYWTGTETYEALKIYMDMNFDGLKDAIIEMLGNGRCKINYRKFQNDMTTFRSRDDVLTLLVHLGYLAYDEETREVFIPNIEISDEFQNAIEGEGWEVIAKILRDSDELLRATICQDEEAVAKGIDEAHMAHTSILSYHDENSLSCVISNAYFSARKDYLLFREQPAGKGFADIIFVPRAFSDRPAFVVELKWNQSAKGGINQIKERKYVKALEDYQGEILLVAANYNKTTKNHQCVIEKYEQGGR